MASAKGGKDGPAWSNEVMRGVRPMLRPSGVRKGMEKTKLEVDLKRT